VNADFFKCFYPEPCTHLAPDEEVEELRSQRAFYNDEESVRRRRLVNSAKKYNRLTDPDQMTGEPDWRRSLVKKR
jgi:hypothetical protein